MTYGIKMQKGKKPEERYPCCSRNWAGAVMLAGTMTLLKGLLKKMDENKQMNVLQIFLMIVWE